MLESSLEKMTVREFQAVDRSHIQMRQLTRNYLYVPKPTCCAECANLLELNVKSLRQRTGARFEDRGMSLL